MKTLWIILCIIIGTVTISFGQTTIFKTIEQGGKHSTYPIQKYEQKYPYDVKMINLKGDTISSDQVFAQNGEPTVLLFWLTTCVPCKYEINAIIKKYDEWATKADFNFYAIALDFPKYQPDFFEDAAAFPFESYLDYNRGFKRVMPDGINGTPQTFVLNSSGAVTYHKRKYRIGDEDKLFEEIMILHLEGE